MHETEQPTRLFLVRHGESEDNSDGRFGGDNDSPLTPWGHRQAELAAEYLVKQGLSAVISSTARRAMDTGRVIAKRCEAPLIAESALVERSFGSWEGLTFAEAQSLGAVAMSRWLTDPIGATPPGGESLHDAALRVDPVLQRLVSKFQGQAIAIVSHGGVLRAGLTNLLGAPLELALHLAVDNASVTQVDMYGDFPVLQTLNWVSRDAATA